MNNTNIAADTYAALAALPNLPVTINTRAVRDDILSRFSTARVLVKSIDEGSDEDSIGLAAGLVTCLTALSDANLLDNWTEDDLSLTHLSKCDEAFLAGKEACLMELELWYPNLADTLVEALTNQAASGAALGLYAMHAAISSKYKDIYKLAVLQEALSKKETAEPLLTSESTDAKPNDDVPVVTDPLMTLVKRLKMLSSIPDISFRFEDLDGTSFLQILCPSGITIAELYELNNHLENTGRLICENNVISIIVPLF